MGQTIDGFGHVVPKTLIEELIDRGNNPAAGGLPPEGIEYLRQAGVFQESLDANVADMDEYGIDKQVVSIQPANMWKGIEPEEALPYVERANDNIREMADEHPGRFYPIATLPYLEGEYLDELERCVEDLGLHGVQIFTNIQGDPIDANRFDAFYEKVVDLDVPIWIHPTNYAWENWDNINGYGLYLILGWPFETTIAMSRLVLSGTFDRHPELDIICHHMGGVASHLANRLSVLYFSTAPESNERYSEERAAEIRDGFRNFYVDTARSSATEVLESGREFYGTENIVFGTDYPFGPNSGQWFLENEQDAVESMDVTEEEHNAIMGDNIAELLDG